MAGETADTTSRACGASTCGKPALPNKHDVIRAILQRECRGLPLNHAAVMRGDSRLQRAALRLFGRWDAALRAAGINPAGVRKTREWSRKAVVRRIRELAGEGKALNSAAVQEFEAILVSAAHRYFSSWDAALYAAGLNAEMWRKQAPPWTQDSLIRTIREACASGVKVNHAVAAAWKGNSLTRAGVRLFGSWDAALRAAGLDPVRIRRYRKPWTKNTVIQAIRVKHRGGDALAYTTVVPGSLRQAGIRFFGSWNATLLAAGLNPAKIRLYRTRCKPWTAPTTLAEIRRKHRMGEALNTHNISPYSLRLSGVRFFGSWDAALAAAGLDPSKIRKRRKPGGPRSRRSRGGVKNGR